MSGPVNVNGWPSCVVFDFDYTLADTSKGVIVSINYALSSLGLPEADDDAIRQTIGLTMEEALVTLAGESERCHATEFLRLFVEREDEVMADATRLYEFVPAVLDSLRGANVAWGSCRRISGEESSMSSSGMASKAALAR